MREYTSTGKTIKEAIESGLKELDCSIEDVHIEILHEGAKGLFGFFGSKPAIVRLTRNETEYDPSTLLDGLSLYPEQKRTKTETRQPKQAAAKKTDASKQNDAVTVAVIPNNKSTARRQQPRQQQPEAAAAKPRQAGQGQRRSAAPTAQKGERQPRRRNDIQREPREPRVDKEIAPEIMEQAAEKARNFLQTLTGMMNVSVEIETSYEVNTLKINMAGDTLGILIGHRGETLDALQYLTSLQINRSGSDFIRVMLDTENYRKKREEALRRLALRMSNKAVKTNRRVALEPMNPYERRVLHSTLQDSPNVSTHSEGEEPNRRVVIMPK